MPRAAPIAVLDKPFSSSFFKSSLVGITGSSLSVLTIFCGTADATTVVVTPRKAARIKNIGNLNFKSFKDIFYNLVSQSSLCKLAIKESLSLSSTIV